MSKYLKYIMIATLGLLLTNCASSTYTIKKENNKTVKKCSLGIWLILQKIKACDKKDLTNLKTKNVSTCRYWRTAVSPSLELAIDKGKDDCESRNG